MHSLKTRITLTTLAIFLLSLSALSFFASRVLRADMQGVLGDQQFLAASLLAAEINSALADRIDALETLAASVNPKLLDNAPALQTLLEERPIFQQMFNGGAFATRADGTAIASTPVSVQRVGLNYIDRDYIVGALKDGKPTIGRPVIGKQLRVPVLTMAASIRDAQGRVIGSLAGVTVLTEKNFLDRIMQHGYGKDGGYLVLVDSPHRLIVTSSTSAASWKNSPRPA